MGGGGTQFSPEQSRKVESPAHRILTKRNTILYSVALSYRNPKTISKGKFPLPHWEFFKCVREKGYFPKRGIHTERKSCSTGGNEFGFLVSCLIFGSSQGNKKKDCCRHKKTKFQGQVLLVEGNKF